MSELLSAISTPPLIRKAAHENLWLHFSPSPRISGDLPMIVRGEGAYVFDDTGKRYLDGLAGLFTVQVGHGRAELAQAAARQSEQLSFFPLWSYANEPAAELAGRLAALAPGDLNRVFFTNSGSEAVESAWKLAKQYFKIKGKPGKHKAISRTTAYHGTTHGALSITGIPELKVGLRTPGPLHLPGAQHQHLPGRTPWRRSRGLWAVGCQPD